MGHRLVGPESYRSKFQIFGAGSSHHGGALLRQQLATQQASATLAAACYQPTTSQTPQVDCPTPIHPHATIFNHTYYIHVWYVFCLQILSRPGEPSDNAHIQCVVQYTMLQCFDSSIDTLLQHKLRHHTLQIFTTQCCVLIR